MTSYLCSCIGVSKSGYYNYLNNENKRIEKDKKGSRQIKMVLDNEFNIYFNLKKMSN